MALSAGSRKECCFSQRCLSGNKPIRADGTDVTVDKHNVTDSSCQAMSLFTRFLPKTRSKGVTTMTSMQHWSLVASIFAMAGSA